MSAEQLRLFHKRSKGSRSIEAAERQERKSMANEHENGNSPAR